MRINPSNIAASNWQAKPEAPSSRSASAQENVQKMREISASKRVTADDSKKNAAAEEISSSKKSLARRTSSTYSLHNGSQKSIDVQAMYANQYSNDQRNDSSQSSGYAGRVNSRLNQDAINTYRSHQFLDKRDEIVTSFGINEFA